MEEETFQQDQQEKINSEEGREHASQRIHTSNNNDGMMIIEDSLLPPAAAAVAPTRQHDDEEEDLDVPAAAAAAVEGGATGICSEEESKRLRRVMANRRSARASYQRRKRLFSELEGAVDSLSKENQTLVNQNKDLRERVFSLRQQLGLNTATSSPNTMLSSSAAAAALAAAARTTRGGPSVLPCSSQSTANALLGARGTTAANASRTASRTFSSPLFLSDLISSSPSAAAFPSGSSLLTSTNRHLHPSPAASARHHQLVQQQILQQQQRQLQEQQQQLQSSLSLAQPTALHHLNQHSIQQQHLLGGIPSLLANINRANTLAQQRQGDGAISGTAASPTSFPSASMGGVSTEATRTTQERILMQQATAGIGALNTTDTTGTLEDEDTETSSATNTATDFTGAAQRRAGGGNSDFERLIANIMKQGTSATNKQEQQDQ